MLLDKILIYTTRKFVENGVTDRSLCKTYLFPLYKLLSYNKDRYLGVGGVDDGTEFLCINV